MCEKERVGEREREREREREDGVKDIEARGHRGNNHKRKKVCFHERWTALIETQSK